MGKGSTTRRATCSSTRRLHVTTFYVLRSFRLERLFVCLPSSSSASQSAFHSSSDARLFERIDMIPRHLTIFLARLISPFANVEFTHHMAFLCSCFLVDLGSYRRHPSCNHFLSSSLYLAIYTPARSLKALAQLRLIESFQFHAIHLHCVSVLSTL